MDHDGTVMTCRKRCPRFHWGTLYPFPFETSRDSGLFGTKKISSKRNVWMSFCEDQRIMIIDGVVWIGTFHGTFGRLHSATRGMQYGSILQLNLYIFPKWLFWKEIRSNWADTWNGWIIWTSIRSQHLSLYIFTPFPLRSDREGAILLGSVEIAYWPHPSDSLLVQRPRGRVVERAHASLVSVTFQNISMPLLWFPQRSYFYCFNVKMMSLNALAPGLGRTWFFVKAFCAVSCSFCPNGLLKS